MIYNGRNSKDSESDVQVTVGSRLNYHFTCLKASKESEFQAVFGKIGQ